MGMYPEPGLDPLVQAPSATCGDRREAHPPDHVRRRRGGCAALLCVGVADSQGTGFSTRSLSVDKFSAFIKYVER